MRIQITLTPSEGKRIIAKGIKAYPLVRQVRKRGKVILKGGTTISAVSEELCGRPMKVSGMITPKGTLTSKFKHESNVPHGLILTGRQIIALDSAEAWEKEIPPITPEDLVITGANAFDAYGHAVVMAGTYAGGKSLPSFQTMLVEGVPFLIAVGLEKFAPGDLGKVVSFAGRKRADFSYGMSVGLAPIFGKVSTELEALKTLTGV